MSHARWIFAVRTADSTSQSVRGIRAGLSGQRQESPHHRRHLLFRGVPFPPTTACFDLQRGVLEYRQAARDRREIAAPRAWPSKSVEAGLTFTNTFSTATWPG